MRRAPECPQGVEQKVVGRHLGVEEKCHDEADKREKIVPARDEISTRGTDGCREGEHLASGSDGAASRLATDVSM